MKLIKIIIPLLFSILFFCVQGDRKNPFDAIGNNYSYVTDIDGNLYQIVKIGSQTWMKENLRTTTFNNGDPITFINDSAEWANCAKAGKPAYCYYDNTSDTSFQKRFGALYNWYAAENKMLAPKGWHVPTKEDFETLRKYLFENGFNYDGTTDKDKVAKSLATSTDWDSTGTNYGDIGDEITKNNRSGFSALPGGRRGNEFEFKSKRGYWWSSTEYANSIFQAWKFNLSHNIDSATMIYHYKYFGCSVRLVKD